MNPPASPFPLRLKQSRQLRGLSLRELSERMNQSVSHVALAKYEQGEMKPSGEVLAKLCEVLGRTPDFMFRPVRVSLSNVSFRKRKAFSEKQTAAVLEVVRNRLEDYLEAEELVPEPTKPPTKLNPPSGFNPDDLEPIRKLARDLRKDWGLNDEPISNLVELLENHGYRVIQLKLDEKGFDGCEVADLHALIIGTWPDHSVARMRLTLAHELAHSLLNEWAKKFGLTESQCETVMNTFASEFLLPSTALKRYLGAHRTAITMAELEGTKLRFGISIAAIVYALKSLGIINESAHRRFYTQIVSQWKKEGIGEPGDEELSRAFREQPARFQRLVRRGISEGIISLSRGAGLLGKPLSELRRETVPIVE